MFFENGLLEGKEWIVLCRRLAVFANIVSRLGYRLHGDVVAAKGRVGNAQWMPVAHRLRQLGSNCGANPWLHEFPVVGEIDLGYAGGGGKPPLILRRIAAHRPNIVQRALFAAHDPLPARQLRIGGIGGFGFEGCLVEPGRENVDQVDVAGKFAVLFLRHAARDEYSEMPDRFVNSIDDGLPVGPDLVDIAVKIKNPIKRLLRRRDVVAL